MPPYSALWNGVYAENYALQVNRSPVHRHVSRALRRRGGRVLGEVIDTVVNGSSINGGAAVGYRRRVAVPDPGSNPNGGGAIPMETLNQIPAAAVVGAANVSAARIDGLVDFLTRPATYPVDLSGNGGGGRLTAQYAVNG